MALEQLQVVLVEPAGPLNIGSISRVIKNFGIHKLVIVNPQCDPFSEQAKRMAVHAKDVLMQANVVDTLEDALKGVSRSIATTTRERLVDMKMETPRETAPWLLEVTEPTAMVFGPEDRGLSNQELNYSQRWVTIPTNPEYSSLNLAQAVSICAYEIYAAANHGKVSQLEGEPIAKVGDVSHFLKQTQSLLLRIGYLHQDTVEDRMAKFRRMLNRYHLSTKELGLVRGVVAQMKWALDNPGKVKKEGE